MQDFIVMKYGPINNIENPIIVHPNIHNNSDLYCYSIFNYLYYFGFDDPDYVRLQNFSAISLFYSDFFSSFCLNHI